MMMGMQLDIDTGISQRAQLRSIHYPEQLLSFDLIERYLEGACQLL